MYSYSTKAPTMYAAKIPEFRDNNINDPNRPRMLNLKKNFHEFLLNCFQNFCSIAFIGKEIATQTLFWKFYFSHLFSAIDEIYNNIVDWIPPKIEYTQQLTYVYI